MKVRLLDFLICPSCGGGFDLNSTQQNENEILEGFLHCRSCASTFFIMRGVPRMVPGDSGRHREPLRESEFQAIEEFKKLAPLLKQRFFDEIAPITPASLNENMILEAGCRRGRNVYHTAMSGAREVIGVDMSEQVDEAYALIRDLPNAHIVQADLRRLPFGQVFDTVISLEVMHTIPDPRQAFFSLLRHLHTGGRIFISIFSREGRGWMSILANSVRRIIRNLPAPLRDFFSIVFAGTFKLVLAGIYRPVSRWRALKEYGRYLPYYEDFVAMSDLPFSEIHTMTSDFLMIDTTSFVGFDQISDWFERGYLADGTIQSFHGRSWRGTGIRL